MTTVPEVPSQTGRFVSCGTMHHNWETEQLKELEMERSTPWLIATVVALVLPLGAWTADRTVGARAASAFSYKLKTFEFKPDGEGYGLNDRGVVVGTTEGDPSGASGVAI